MSGKKGKTKVVLLGWDAADWNFITPLLDAGEMPSLAALINNGVMGKIKTLDPPLSPILWTSVATGKYGDDHGVLSFIEPSPETGERRPVSVHSRKVRALWNILHKNGIKTNVCGWWPSYPCEPINGVMVSNHFADFNKEDGPDNWNLAPYHVHPASEYEELKNLRIHPAELTWSHIGPFLPEATQELLDNPKHRELLSQVPAILSRCSTFHNAATHILENKDWEFVGLYLDAIDRASHEFMKYHPPMQEHIDADEFKLFNHVMTGFYKYHDMMLDRILNLIDDDTHVILLSDHGFYSDEKRLKELPKDSMAPAYEHSPYGILCMTGPGIKKDEIIYGSTLLDIAPTVLHLFGLPVAEDMAGKVLVQAFETPQTIAKIPTYEGGDPKEWGELNPEEKDDIWAAQDSLEQLIALGYVEPLTDDVETQRMQMQYENKYHLARIKYSRGKIREAVDLFNELLEQTPKNGKLLIRLLNCYITLKDPENARRVLKTMRTIFGSYNTAYIDMLESKIWMLELRPAQARELLSRVESNTDHTSESLTLLAKSYLMLREWKLANKAFQQAVALNTESSEAYHGLSVTFLRMGKFKQAVEAGFNAIAITFWYPAAHFHLGEALIGLGEPVHAANALELSLQQEPGFSMARKMLVKLYSNELKNQAAADVHQKILDSHMRPKITIVSGLPRSGTSMMMQMLNAGGCDILTDEIRQSDENNPKGYMEYEAVKNLMKDNSWLPEQNGKTIKVISHLLGSLSPKCDYKIIFMERDLDEVLMSQQKMLGKNKLEYNTKLRDTFLQQKEKNKVWLNAQQHMEVLYVNYADVVANPREEAERISLFLDEKPDVEKMVQAVDSELYRNHAGSNVEQDQ